MRIIVYSMCLALAILGMPGCGGKKKTDTAQKTSNTNTGSQNTATVSSGKKEPAKSMPKQRYSKNGHPIPSVGTMGGGGSMNGSADGGPPGRSNKKETSQTASSGTSSTGGSSSNFNVAGLANGLFPQSGSGTYTSVYNPSQTGGGLFPQRGTGGATTSNAPTSNSNITPSASTNTSVAATEEPKSETKASGKGELYDMASEAFGAGEGSKGLNYVYAHLLATDDALDDYPMKWHAGVKSPRVALRWGVGVVRGGSLEGRAPVIGEAVEDEDGGNTKSDPEQLNLGTGGSRGNGSGSNNDDPTIYQRVDTDSATGLLLYYTGDVAEQLIKEFDSRRLKGTYFGSILKSMPEVLPADLPEEAVAETAAPSKPVSRNGASFGRKKNRNLPSVGNMGGGAPGGGAPKVRDNAGSGTAAAGGGESSTRKSKSLVTRWGGTSSDNPDGEVIGELTPGLVGLGEGSKEDLIDRAKENGVDCLLVIQINGLKRKEKVYSNTRIRLVNLADGRDVTKTKNMSNLDVMRSRQAGRKDPLARYLEEFFSDEDVAALRAADMPNIDEDAAINRVAKLTETAEFPLRDAVEVMWYYRQGLLLEDQAIEAVNSLLDGVGKTIVTGTEKQRLEVLSRLIQ